MELKNIKTLSVDEIRSYINDLSAEFERVKKEIRGKCEYLDELTGEYNDSLEELEKRKDNENGNNI